MSNNESFIDEVNEEVQRDKLFQFIRRYGWIGIVLVLLLVGGAAWNEWRKAQEVAEAQALGDGLLAALEASDPAARAEALAAVEAEGEAVIVRDMLRAAELSASGEPGAAADLLNEVAQTPGIDPVYGDLVRLKAAMLSDAPPSERIATLDPLAAPGAPYRLLALEQIALAETEAGETEAAIATATDILQDAALGRGLRERMQNLIVTLGGNIPDSVAPVPPAAEPVPATGLDATD